jgi:hypothetical protein
MEKGEGRKQKAEGRRGKGEGRINRTKKSLLRLFCFF